MQIRTNMQGVITVLSKLFHIIKKEDREGGKEMQEGGDMGIYVYV